VLRAPLPDRKGIDARFPGVHHHRAVPLGRCTAINSREPAGQLLYSNLVLAVAGVFLLLGPGTGLVGLRPPARPVHSWVVERREPLIKSARAWGRGVRFRQVAHVRGSFVPNSGHVRTGALSSGERSRTLVGGV
jgi:hypothetical protein